MGLGRKDLRKVMRGCSRQETSIERQAEDGEMKKTGPSEATVEKLPTNYVEESGRRKTVNWTRLGMVKTGLSWEFGKGRLD